MLATRHEPASLDCEVADPSAHSTPVARPLLISPACTSRGCAEPSAGSVQSSGNRRSIRGCCFAQQQSVTARSRPRRGRTRQLPAARDSRARSGRRRPPRTKPARDRSSRPRRDSSRSRSRHRSARAPPRARCRRARVHRHRPRVHRLDQRRALAVPELAHVEVAAPAVQAVDPDPAEHDVAGGLRQSLALDDPLAVVVEGALAEERLEHRCLRLLELQEQRIALVTAEHQHDPGARPDAADADDLPRRVDVAEALEQLPAVGRQGAPVGPDGALNELLEVIPVRRRPRSPRSG